MRAIRFVALMLVTLGIVCAAQQADASLRRRYRSANAPTPSTDKAAANDKTPAPDKSATTPPVDKKADVAPTSTSEPETKTRRRLFFKRRTVAQKSPAAAAAPAVTLASTQTFLLVSDPVPAASDTPATPAPAKATQNVKTKRRLFGRRRSGRRMKTASA